MAEATARVLSIQDRIAASKRASAVERAWKVAKALEEGRHQLANLRWVEPKQGDKGISRRIDFASDFPEGVGVLIPVPMGINVYAPAKQLVPGEDLGIAWTMPMLVRTAPASDLPLDIRSNLSVFGNHKTRPTVEVVSFLPFPRAGAPPEEQFQTEFFVRLDIDADLGSSDSFFCGIVRYGGKVIKQFVDSSNRSSIIVVADPYHQTLFKAEMLVTLTEEQLATTAPDAGILDIFIYRVKKGGFSIKDFDLSKLGLGGDNVIHFDNFRSPDISPIMGGDSLSGTTRSPTKGLSSVPGLGLPPSLPSPAATPKEVGDVRVGEGTKGEAVQYETLEGYAFDSGFAVQRVSIRFLGVREASREATIQALEQLAAG